MSRTPKPLPPKPLGKRLNATTITLVVFIGAVIYSAFDIQGSGRSVNVWENLTRFFSAFFPPDLSVWRQTMAALFETIKIAVLATFFAVILSLIVALGAAQNIAPRSLVVTMRMLLNIIRSIPSLIWAVIAVAAVGANPIAGVVALTFYSMGYLGKFFSEAFESIDPGAQEALRSIGSHPIQAFQYGMFPNAKPLIWSHSIWMLEYNIRSASIIGYVGAGGLGLQLHTYQSFHQWDRFCTVLLCILAVVTILDFLSEWIRNRINGKRKEPTEAEANATR